jgi:uncharacterized SAM-binding protein YcdF (DUF218 family)
VSVYQFFKNGLLPGSLGLFFVLLAICLFSLWRRRTSLLALIAVTSVIAAYCALSMPVVALALSRALAGGYANTADPKSFAGAQAIVVLDGGTSRTSAGDVELIAASAPSAVRALEAIKVFRILDRNPLIVVSGGAYVPRGPNPEGSGIRKALIEDGVDSTRIVLDTTSRNTREHGVNIPRILKSLGVTRFVLVTSALHMRRAMRDFAANGSHPVPAPAALPPVRSASWWPSTGGLDQTVDMFHELAGLLSGK